MSKETASGGTKMAITAEQKTEIITNYQRASIDTGSPEVQIALLTARITDLTEHLKAEQEKPFKPARPLEDGKPEECPSEIPATDLAIAVSGSGTATGIA